MRTFLYIFVALSIATESYFVNGSNFTQPSQSCFSYATCTNKTGNYTCTRNCEGNLSCSCELAGNSSMVCQVGDAPISMHCQQCDNCMCNNASSFTMDATDAISETNLKTVMCFSGVGFIRYTFSQCDRNIKIHNLTFCAAGGGSNNNESDETTAINLSRDALRITAVVVSECLSNLTLASIDNLIQGSSLYTLNLPVTFMINCNETENCSERNGSHSTKDIFPSIRKTVRNVSEISNSLRLNSSFFLTLLVSHDETNPLKMVIFLANMTSNQSASCYLNMSISAKKNGFTTAVAGNRDMIQEDYLKRIAGDDNNWFVLGDNCDEELTTLGLACLIHNLTANSSSQGCLGCGCNCDLRSDFSQTCNNYNFSCKDECDSDGFRCSKLETSASPTSSNGTPGSGETIDCFSCTLQMIRNATTTDDVKEVIEDLKSLAVTSNQILHKEVKLFAEFMTGITNLLENGKIEVSSDIFQDIAGIASAINNGYFQRSTNQSSSIQQVNALRNELSQALPFIALHVQLNESSPTFSFSNSLANFTVSLHLDFEVKQIESVSGDVHVIIPSSAVAKAWGMSTDQTGRNKRQDINEERKSAFLFYKDDSLFYSDQNVSSIVSVDVGLNGGVSGLSDPVKITHPNQLLPYGKSSIENDTLKVLKTTMLCAYWDYKQENWLTEGCCLNLSQNPECLCNHLTNFALIVKSENVPADAALSIVSDVGCAVSIVGLVATVLIHVVSPELRQRRPAKILIQICINLCIANVIFVSGTTHALNSKGWCYLVAFLLHYFLLVTWCWMSVYTYDMHNSLVKVFATARSYYLRKLAGFAYGLSALIATTTVAIAVGHFDQNASNHMCGTASDPNAASAYVADNVCWLKSYSLYLGFLAPVGVMLLYNIITFAIVFREIAMKTKVQSSASKHTNKQRLVVAVTMATFIGLTWVFGFFVLLSEDRLYISVTSWIFALLNIFQGFGIFMLTAVRRKEMRQVWWTPLRSKVSNISTRVITAISKAKDEYVVTPDTDENAVITEVTTEVTQASEVQKKEYFVEVKDDLRDNEKKKKSLSEDEQKGSNKEIKSMEINESNEDTEVLEDDNKKTARSWLYRTLETKI